MSAFGWVRLAFSVVVLAVFVYAAVEALEFSKRARYLPLYVSIVGALLTACMVGLEIFRSWRQGEQVGSSVPQAADSFQPESGLTPDEQRIRLKRTAYYLAWMIAYLATIAVVGLPAASAAFLGSFLWIEGRMSLIGISVSVAGMLGFLYAITHIMHLHWPPNLLGI